MNTYLLTWNPLFSKWDNIEDEIEEIAQKGFIAGRYSTGSTKRIHTGDRVFLMKLGKPPKGIIGSGWSESDVFEEVRWNDPTKMALYINVKWDVLVNFNETMFPIEVLKTGIYGRVNWTPMGSGMSIPDDVAEELEIDWEKYLKHSGIIPHKPNTGKIDDIKYYEGEVKHVSLSIFERNGVARSVCIKKYGARCSVCDLDFSEKYGGIGAGFIHVHHLRPLSEIREGYILDPVEDLRPVCPNCHAMLHQKNPEPYSIEELIAILKHQDKIPLPTPKPKLAIVEVAPANPPIQISNEGVYKCSICRSYIYGYDREKHVQKTHKGKLVEWSKVRNSS